MTPEVQDTIERIQRLLEGEPVDLRGVQLDLDGIAGFHRRVHAIARETLAGQTRSYDDIATELGDADADALPGITSA